MADLRWNNVNASFNDSNQAMSNALSGISKAGTVFGELRKSLLEQEQRDIENAFKIQAMNEGRRQFNIKQAADEADFLERQRQFDANFAQTAEANAAMNAYRMGMLGVQQAQDARAQSEFDRNRAYQNRLAEVTASKVADLQTRQDILNKKKAELDAAPDGSELQKKLQAEYNNLQAVNYTAKDADQDIKNAIASEFGIVPQETALTKFGDAEVALNQERTKLNRSTQEKLNEKRNAGFKAFDDNNQMAADEKRFLSEAYIKGIANPEFATIPPELFARALTNFAGERKMLSYLPYTDRTLQDYAKAGGLSKDIADKNSDLYRYMKGIAAGFATGKDAKKRVDELAQQNDIDGAPTPIWKETPYQFKANAAGTTNTGLDFAEQQLNKAVKEKREKLKGSKDHNDMIKQILQNEYGSIALDKLPKKTQETVTNKALDAVLNINTRSEQEDMARINLEKLRREAREDRANELLDDLMGYNN